MALIFLVFEVDVRKMPKEKFERWRIKLYLNIAVGVRIFSFDLKYSYMHRCFKLS